MLIGNPIKSSANHKDTAQTSFTKSTDPHTLKTVYTIGNCQRPVFSLSVSAHNHTITNLWKFELNWLSKLRDMNEIKNNLVTRSCFQMLDSETSNSKLEVSKSNSWKITSFSKTTSLQRELFLTMFCFTINLSPLLVTKYGVM